VYLYILYIIIYITSSASKNNFSLYANLITSTTFSLVSTWPKQFKYANYKIDNYSIFKHKIKLQKLDSESKKKIKISCT